MPPRQTRRTRSACSPPSSAATANLAKYDAVIFLSTTGDPVPRPEAKAAFERYIQSGGGYLGIHAASDGGYTWAWYGGLVGAYFRDHPAIQQALVRVVGQGTEATRDLPNKWWRTDEWYNFQTNPRGAVRVLTTIDESTYNPVGYTGGSMGIRSRPRCRSCRRRTRCGTKPRPRS